MDTWQSQLNKIDFEFFPKSDKMFKFYSGGVMIEKQFLFVGLLFIMILCFTEIAESKVYPPGFSPGINGVENSNNNSGGTTESGGGGSRHGKTVRHPRLSKPDFDKTGNGNGRSKRQQKKNKNQKKSENRKSRKRSDALSVSSGSNALKFNKSKKKSRTKKLAKQTIETAEQLMPGQHENKTEVVRVERVDDLPLLLAVMMQMNLHKILDNHIPVHWKQRNLSWGLTCIIWLAYILSEGDHRKVSVREYVKKLSVTLSSIVKQKIDELDFTDDRLGVLLKYLSKKSYWEKIEKDLSERTIEAYELPAGTVRCDATTVSGYHEIEQDSLFQRGVSKDNPKLPQIKIMTGALDPLGMPLASDIVSGEKADDILYRPVIERINEYLKNNDVIYVGDSKMSSVETRLYIKGIDKHYLCPLPQTGNTAKNMKLWIKIGMLKGRENELNEVYAKKDDKEKLIARGYEFDRTVSGEVDGENIEWTERVLIVNSPSYAKSQAAGLERRIANAVKKLYALTPDRGPGKRQITDEETLKTSISRILKQHKVEGLLCCKYEKEVEREEKYVGKGKGSVNRPKRIIEKVRFQMLSVNRNEYRIKKEKARQGWKVFVTDVSLNRLDFGAVVKCYRKEYRVERIFNRLKSRMNIAPLYVKRDDQIKGKTHLLTIGARVLTIIEYQVRRSLQNDRAKLKGLYPENPGKPTDMPTSEKLLKVFSDINLTFLESQGVVTRFLTPLTDLQQEILKRLGLQCSVYKNLEITKSPAILSEW